MTHMRNATAIAIAALTAACSPAKPAAPAASAAPAAVATPGIGMKAFGINPSVLADCASNLKKVADINVDIGDINPHAPTAHFGKKDANGNSTPIASGDDAGAAKPTQLDFDMGLRAPGDSVAITITVPASDHNLYFRDTPTATSQSGDPSGSIRSPWAITAAEPNGSLMFCGPVFVDSSKKSATFTAYYYSDGSGKPVFGSFNIGLIVEKPAAGGHKKFYLPVFLDPNVKNNG